MNKIIKKLAAVVSCFAILLVAGVSLTACGKKEEPTPPPADTTTHVATVEQFTNALKTDGVVITLDANLTITETTFTVDKNVTLDLNGHNITTTLENGKSYDLFNIVGGKLTVNATNGGEMSVTGDENAGYIFYVGSYKSADGAAKKGELVINGGSYKTTDATVAQATYGKITVNGGRFEARKYVDTNNGNYGLLFNRLNKNADVYSNTTKYPTESFNYDNDVKIVINGGTFYSEYNPANNDGAKEDYVGAPTGYLASGKTATQVQEGADQGWYVVA